MPVKTYEKMQDCVATINERPRPLGLYYFGTDSAERDYVLNNTTFGGVTINDVFFHVAQEDLPFGGVGASGMGAYHGRDGFDEFSHKKAVYTQAGVIFSRLSGHLMARNFASSSALASIPDNVTGVIARYAAIAHS